MPHSQQQQQQQQQPPSAIEAAGLWSRISFSWVAPLIHKGWHTLQLEQDDARFLLPQDTDAPQLSRQFEAAYGKLKAKYAARSRHPNLTTLTLLRLYWPLLLYHSFWVLCEVGIRLLSPLALRHFLEWLQADSAAPGSTPVGLGWCWAIAVASGGVGMTLVHHQFFWIGMRMGFTMRQQVVAAIHAKVLRLNSAAVAHANSGTIINLASNDVRRFDEGFSFWLFCWAGPLEAAMVLLMVSLELGFVPAICGMAAMLAVIPLQALLVRTIAGLRRNTAARTDERVRLTGEVIQGCLAMKMLAWEDPFARSISGIRQKEVAFSGRMAQIRGLNLSLQFCMTPVVAFVTFSVYIAMGSKLNLPSVFYALSLLRLPQLYLVYFAVIGFQYLTETYIAVQRIDKFLSMPEPPPPVHMRAKPAAATAAGTAADAVQSSSKTAAASRLSTDAEAAAAGGSKGSGLLSHIRRKSTEQQQQQQEGRQVPAGSAAAEGDVVMCRHPDGYVELGGADYDWNTNVEEMTVQDTSNHPRSTSLVNSSTSPASPTPAAAAATDPQQQTSTSLQQPAASPNAPNTAIDMVRAASAATAATSRSSMELLGQPTRRTLIGVKLQVQPGELLAVVGEVGAGKSSLLAALLGELMPMRGPDGAVHGGPVVVGRVAYCSQVPWIMAATLRDNILFQAPYDEVRYNAVINACALNQDLAELPAGDMTELGERGINLSGGQKARVALARAAYSAASVQLLDDPLSAVDPRVGRILFDKCIGPQGMLAGCTRVLVTHQRQFLHKCDRIAVLRHGCLLACGSWQDLLPLQLPELVGGAVTMSLDVAEEGVEEVDAEQQQAEQQQQQDAGQEAGADSQRAAAAAGSEQQQQDGEEQQSAAAAADEELPEVFKEAAAKPFAAGAAASATGDKAQLSSGNSEAHEGSNSSSSSGGGEKFKKKFPLSRERTMAPDINRRPADSGRPSSSSNGSSWWGSLGLGGSLNPSRSMSRFVRNISRRFGSRRDVAAGGKAAAAAAEDASSDDDFFGDEGAGNRGSFAARGLADSFAYAQLAITRSISSLFVPPAYLPGGPLYAGPAAAAPAAAAPLQKVDSGKAFGRQDSRRGLALLAPVRSLIVLSHQASLQRGLSMHTAAAAAAKAAGSTGDAAAAAAAAGQLVTAEKRETGSVSWKVYGAYAQQVGLVTSWLMLSALVLGQGVYLAADWWLAMWSASPTGQQLQMKWLLVYGLLTAGVIFVSLMRSGLFFWATMRAATRLHNSMLLRVLRAPLAFFHTNPAGRVLNRFSNDQGRVDDMLPIALFDVLQTGFVCLGAFVLVAVAVPFILPVFVALLIAFYYFRQRYITTSREIKRWDATSRSPVYASFSATLKGLPTIRAYGAESHFQESFISHLSLNGQWWYAYLATARWIGFRLDLIATITLTMAVLLAMAVRTEVKAAILGLSLTHVLQLTGTLQWWTRQTVEVENNMTCVERMVEYTQLPQEPPRLAEGGAPPPPGWPATGSITYKNVTAGYRPGLPPVLQNLSFHLPPGTSCGVVGRTGSGKSSLMLTLFRLIDVNTGSIFLDGVDTASIALDALRRQLAIIPQDPVLFSGTLRSNLDPWDQHDDAALWRVLSAVQLKAAIRAAGGLHVRMTEAGDNLSVGQRQLFCLARALLQEAKVLALDEATANVDRSTDALIQQSLRQFTSAEAGKSSGRVLLVIAHRIDTILDCDHLLVLSNGQLVEQGAPKELAAQTGGQGQGQPGMFASMVEAAKAAAAGHHH